MRRRWSPQPPLLHASCRRVSPHVGAPSPQGCDARAPPARPPKGCACCASSAPPPARTRPLPSAGEPMPTPVAPALGNCALQTITRRQLVEALAALRWRMPTPPASIVALSAPGLGRDLRWPGSCRACRCHEPRGDMRPGRLARKRTTERHR
jgi:hypothetical protein